MGRRCLAGAPVPISGCLGEKGQNVADSDTVCKTRRYPPAENDESRRARLVPSPTMESIYNLVPEQYVEPAKPAMYRSKHDPNAPVTGSTFGTQGTTQLSGAGIVKKRDNGAWGWEGADRVAREPGC